MLLSGEGFVRILTIVARGYLWKSGEPNAARARRALCAWCSIPEKEKASPKEDWENSCAFPELHTEFSELVDEYGNGWLIRHVQAMCRFAEENPRTVSESIRKKVPLLREKFPDAWRAKVIQYQVPIFSAKTKGAWILRFDDVLGEAMELGPLRDSAIIFTEEQKAKIAAATPAGIDSVVLETLIAYYLLNKTVDSEWAVLPVTNFTAYFANTSFDRKWLPALRKGSIQQDETSFGVSRYKISEELLSGL